LKRIIFLIIATLLVLGLLLPGCGDGGGGGFTNWITIGVVCPMSVAHGQQQWLAAQMARDEINAAGGVNITAGVYGIKLTKINTLTEENPALAQAALQAVIDDVDYVVGGFRTETVFPLVETTMDVQKLFLIAGAATANILRLVAWNNTRYQYVFRGTPFNDVFLLTNMYKFMGGLAKILAAHNVSKPYSFAVIAENLAWTATMRAILATDALGKQALLGYTNATVVVCSPTATDLSSELQGIANSTDPVLIMPILSAAATGTAYTSARPTYLPNAVSFGINVASQLQFMWSLSGGKVRGEMFLDTYGDGCNISALTAPFLSAFAANCTLTSGDYPMYTATVYDIIKGLAVDIDAADSLADNALVTQMRSGRFYTTAGAPNAGYYPMPEITLVAGNITPGSGVFALNASQAFALYPHLVEYYNALGHSYADYAAMAANWVSDNHTLDWTSNPGGLVPNDLVYGPGYTTGLVTQWQNTTGVGKKVGVWPNVPTGYGSLANLPAHTIYLANSTTFNGLVAAGVIDQYGNWIINYPGTQPIQLDTSIFVNHGGF
jgi:branched-chain amino acid transport system substrate-binding protein